MSIWAGMKSTFSKKAKDIDKPAYRILSGSRNRTASFNIFDTSMNLKNYEYIYQTDSITFSTINALAYSSVYCGHQILNDDNSAVENFYKKTKISEVLVQAITSALVYGDGYVEKVFGRGGAKDNLLELVVRDPKSIVVERDDYGKVIRYIQLLEGGKKNYIDPQFVVHIRFYGLPSNISGISLIGANIELINRRRIADQSIATAIERHGTPRYHIKLHPIENEGVKTYPDDNVLDEVESKFEEISAKHEFATIDLIDILPLDSKGVEGVEEYYNYFTSLQAAGFSVPLEMLGFSGSSTEASSRTRLLMFERHIKSFQRIIENILNNEVHPFIRDANSEAEFMFGDVSPTDDLMRIQAIEPLLNTNAGTYDIIDRDEIRFRAGFLRKSKDENVVKEDVEEVNDDTENNTT